MLLLRVELFQEVKVVVNQSESSASAAAESCLEAVDGDAVLFDFQLFCKLLLKLGLRDAAHLGVNDFNLLNKMSVADTLTACLLPSKGFFKNLRTYSTNLLSDILINNNKRLNKHSFLLAAI